MDVDTVGCEHRDPSGGDAVSGAGELGQRRGRRKSLVGRLRRRGR
ncbi:Uncharacterised protein [Mycobacteroides abscessus]|nr:Uncharacterised protein [Mycobacteroides abscessus]CQA12415.1 Uncharacterised protein [Mycobacteroides abscessus]SHW49092.1 Uncharacterised protein [Mycobacteroides abscessus subsp. abscessus]